MCKNIQNIIIIIFYIALDTSIYSSQTEKEILWLIWKLEECPSGM